MPKTLIESLKEPIPVDENMEDYSNEPFFLDKAARAAQFIKEHPFEPKLKTPKRKTPSKRKAFVKK